MHISRVSHGHPHPSGHGWFLKLDCGHGVHESQVSYVGTQMRCAACERSNADWNEGCGGDAILDRNVP
jgi:hypothetical protein